MYYAAVFVPSTVGVKFIGPSQPHLDLLDSAFILFRGGEANTEKINACRQVFCTPLYKQIPTEESECASSIHSLLLGFSYYLS